MENLNEYEIKVLKFSLEVRLKEHEIFKCGNLTVEEKKKIDREINTIKEILLKLER